MATELRYINPDVSRRLRASAIAFHTKVWPCIETHFGGGSLEAVEGRDDAETLAQLLDSCGIDAFVVHNEPQRHAFGLASRTWAAIRDGRDQWDIPRGFSLRGSKTYGEVCYTHCEYEKLKYVFLEAEDPGAAVHPHYTVHATFIDKEKDEKPVYIAIVKTVELIRYMAAHESDETKITRRRMREATFFSASASLMRESCPSLREYLFTPKHLAVTPYHKDGVSERGYVVNLPEVIEVLERDLH